MPRMYHFLFFTSSTQLEEEDFLGPLDPLGPLGPLGPFIPLGTSPTLAGFTEVILRNSKVKKLGLRCVKFRLSSLNLFSSTFCRVFNSK